MRSATCCALSPAKATHLYLLYMTEKNYQTTAGRSVHTDRLQLEVLHRVHPSALLMIDTCRKLWAVSSKKRNITAGT